MSPVASSLIGRSMVYPNSREILDAWVAKEASLVISEWAPQAVATALFQRSLKGRDLQTELETDDVQSLESFLSLVDLQALQIVARHMVRRCVRQDQPDNGYVLRGRSGAVLTKLWERGACDLVQELAEVLAAKAAVPRLKAQSYCAGRWYAFSILMKACPEVGAPHLKALVETTADGVVREAGRWATLLLHPKTSRQDKIALLGYMNKTELRLERLSETGARDLPENLISLLADAEMRPCFEKYAVNYPRVHLWLANTESAEARTRRLPQVVAASLPVAREIIERYGPAVSADLSSEDWDSFLQSADGEMRKFGWLMIGMASDFANDQFVTESAEKMPALAGVSRLVRS